MPNAEFLYTFPKNNFKASYSDQEVYLDKILLIAILGSHHTR
jgi:hypothetical protein